MFELIRPATTQEVESFKDRADLTPTSAVVAFPNGDKLPDFAVLRQCTEIDPVFFSPETSNQRKALFFWALQNYLNLLGTPSIHFNIQVTDTALQAVVEKFGGKPTSEAPELRYRIDFKR